MMASERELVPLDADSLATLVGLADAALTSLVWLPYAADKNLKLTFAASSDLLTLPAPTLDAEIALAAVEDADRRLIICPVVELTRGAQIYNDAETFTDSTLILVTAALGNHQSGAVVTVEASSTANSLRAVLGDLDLNHLIVVGYSTAGVAVVAKVGDHKAGYFVAVGSSATGVGAAAVLGSLALRHIVAISESARGLVAQARLIDERRDHFVSVTYQGAGTAAWAVIGGSEYAGDIRVTYQTTATGAQARLGANMTDHFVRVVYATSGVAARVLLGVHIYGLETEFVNLLHGHALTVAPFFRDAHETMQMAAASDQRPLPAVVYDQDTIDCLTTEAASHGTVAPATLGGFHGEVTMDSTTDGILHAHEAIMQASEAEVGLRLGVEGGLTKDLRAVMLASEAETGLRFAVDGRLAEGIRIVSLASDAVCAADLETDANLTVWSRPYMEDSALYIKQIHGDYIWTGPDLILGGGARLVSQAHEATILADTTREAHLTVWSIPYMVGHDLHINQIHGEYSWNGSDLVLAEDHITE